MKITLLVFFLLISGFALIESNNSAAAEMKIGKVNMEVLLKSSPSIKKCQEELDNYKVELNTKIESLKGGIERLEAELKVFKENSAGRKEVEEKIIKKMLEADDEVILIKRKINQKAVEFEQAIFRDIVKELAHLADRDGISIFYDEISFNLVWVAPELEKKLLEAPDFTEKVKELIEKK